MYPRDNTNQWFQGQGLWSHVPASDWKNWKWQLKKPPHHRGTGGEIPGAVPAGARRLLFLRAQARPGHYPVLFQPHRPGRTRTARSDGKIIPPRGGDGDLARGVCSNPVGEEGSMAVKGIVHRYPDRVLFLVTDRCASYCRYCTRSAAGFQRAGLQFSPGVRVRPQVYRGAPGSPRRAPLRR